MVSIPCPHCQGRGLSQAGTTCPQCHGTGVVPSGERLPAEGGLVAASRRASRAQSDKVIR